jgi:hypothetical protein
MTSASAKSIKCGFAATARRVDVRKAITLSTETTIIGQLLDPFTGREPTGPTATTYIRLKSGTTQLAYSYTNNGGLYGIGSLAAGSDRNLTGDRTGYINTMLRFPITITTGIVAGPYLDALPRARADGNATVLFDWKNIQPIVSTPGCTGACLGWEFDLYVKTPSKAYIGPANPGSLLASPFVRWPRDSADDLLPMETIVIAAAAPNGVYKVFVDKVPYASPAQWNPNWVNSAASFQAYSGGVSGLSPHYYNKSCGAKRYWYVGDLKKTGTAYTWTYKNLCTNVKP